ncbi:MAG: biotin transporter BioY, partial [Silicimonas sp.]|nr:biotin transporter BioY [Silicimonas sp.]
ADRSVFQDGKPSYLEQRILSLLNARKAARRKLLFALTVVPLIAMLAFATVAIQRPGDWSQDRLMLSTVVNLDRLDEINRLSSFGRARN